MSDQEQPSDVAQPASNIDEAIQKLQHQFSTEFEQFNSEIIAFFEVNKQDDETFRRKMHLQQALLDALRKTFRDCQLYPVGSTTGGSATQSSDFDLCFLSQSAFNDAVREADDYLHACVHSGVAWDVLPKIKKALETHCPPELYTNVESQPCGNEPILKFTSNLPCGRQLDVDVSIFGSLSVYKAYLLNHYCKIDARFLMLCLVVKQWAAANGIRDAKHRTFNSYTLVLLVLHFLQCGVKPAVLPSLQELYPDFFTQERPLQSLRLSDPLPSPLPDAPRKEMSVGELLIRFFDYYARLDFKASAVCIPRACLVPRSELLPKTAYYPIFVFDFYERANMARTVSEEKFATILDVFRRTRDALIGDPMTPPSLKKLRIDL
ncbi:PAP/25A associated domain containing protein [Aphelenchoides avenae]|nr:PAP/25A associated domain containing protein [Aphelenchus avenae]